ncbi:MAG: Fe-S cluster assembly protein SufB [Candidatus Andersenbacteria bacterium]
MATGALSTKQAVSPVANRANFVFATTPGLNEETVRTLSAYKQEPAWVLEKRLVGLAYCQARPLPTWGPDLCQLDLDKITYFADPGQKESKSWADVPADIRATFEKLGIPAAERTALGGVGAQYEATMAYHNLQQQWEKLGVIFENFDVALRKYPDLVQPYFMTRCVPINDHKFAALHAAVFSGGTFIYVPPGVTVELPLQAYFRMNAPGMGQFEHTLIIADEGAQVHYIEGCSAPQHSVSNLHAGCVEIYVKAGARVRYSSIENWSKNTYNLNTKRALVERDGVIEFVNGNLGSGVTMLYPAAVLLGEGAAADFIGIAFAGAGQNQDTGSKAIHLAPHTSSTIIAKSISQDGGITTYRGLLKVNRGAHHVTSAVSCDALILDAISTSNTIPYMDVREEKVDIGHEATVGRISAEQLFYLQSRGLSHEQATQMIVSGFIEPVVKQLPLEYAVELNRLITLEMEGSVG